MYQTGELIKFSPFVFKNGNQPKTKYCIVLGLINDRVMIASLPTSKDHVPSDVIVERGCVDIPERGVNAFVFSPNDQVTSSFSFPRPTFVYGEQVDESPTVTTAIRNRDIPRDDARHPLGLWMLATVGTQEPPEPTHEREESQARLSYPEREVERRSQYL